MAQRIRRNRTFNVVLIAAFCIGILLGVKFLSTIVAREKLEELRALAKRLLERPVRIEMQRPEKGPAAPAQPKPPDELLVDDFDVGLTSGLAQQRKNRLGSFQGTFSMRPSFAVITKSSEVRRGTHGQSLVIDYRKEAGWCGWYTLLNGVDVTPYNTLSFWVKGEKGGEKFEIGLSDERMQNLEMDAFFLGCATSFIPGGYVTKEWKEVKVPLARASSELNLSRMGSLVFWLKYGGEGRIYVEDVKFKNDPEISKVEEYNAPQAQRDPQHPRALWVWKIDPVLNVKQRQDLFELCRRTGIAVVYLFFPEFSEPPPADYFQALAEYLKESHGLGIKVEALTGNPVWSLAENHQLCLNWIGFFLDYNKQKPAEERIDGVSLDVEPYLTAEWEKDKGRIKADYLQLLGKCRELIDSYNQGFRLGIAIPFFYDKEDGGNFERSILNYVDYLALMDYYDTPKDIIERARFHIDLAEEMKKKVVIGFETQDLVEMNQGKRRNTFIEEGWEEMERRLDIVKQEFSSKTSFEGFAIHHYDSYKLMTRGKNVPTKERPDNYLIKAPYRASNIAIDGKLDDWPAGSGYPVNEKRYVVYGGGAWKGPQDLSYTFYSQWDEDTLYAAVEVADDAVIQQKTGADMWEGDHAEVWLDMQLEADRTEAVNSEEDFQIGFSPGDFSKLPPEAYIWTPPLPDTLHYNDLIAVASSKTAAGYIIEARLPKEVLFYFTDNPQAGLQKGMQLGIMVDVGDMDDKAHPMKLLMSTSEGRIWGDPTTFGVLELE